jgi:hypothetical protein
MLFTRSRQDLDGPKRSLARGDFLLTGPDARRRVILERSPIGGGNSALGRQSAGGWTARDALVAYERGYCGLILIVTHNQHSCVETDRQQPAPVTCSTLLKNKKSSTGFIVNPVKYVLNNYG